MAFSDYRITNFEKPVSALADTPQMSADALKEWFDSNSTGELKTSVNGIIDEAEQLETAVSGKVDKVDGKGLSTNDFTTAEKTKLAGVEECANRYIHPDSHPTSVIATTPEYRFTSDSEFDLKVDKEVGKGLSSNDYTSAEKGKLSGIEAGANRYIHPDTHSAQMIATSPQRRFTSDAELGGKVDKAEGKGLSSNDYTDAEKNKLAALDAAKQHSHANKTALDAYSEAPADGKQYARKNGAWEAVEEGLPTVTLEGLDTLFTRGAYELQYTEYVNYDGYGDMPHYRTELVVVSPDNAYGESNVTQTRYGYGGNVYTRWGYTGNGTLEGTAWSEYKPDVAQAIATKTDAGTTFTFYSPGAYRLARTTDAAKQLTFYTPSEAQKTKVNEIEIYLTVTAEDSILWDADVLFQNGQIPAFTPGKYYRVLAEFHPLADKWCVGVVEDGAAV